MEIKVLFLGQAQNCGRVKSNHILSIFYSIIFAMRKKDHLEWISWKRVIVFVSPSKWIILTIYKKQTKWWSKSWFAGIKVDHHVVLMKKTTTHKSSTMKLLWSIRLLCRKSLTVEKNKVPMIFDLGIHSFTPDFPVRTVLFRNQV